MAEVEFLARQLLNGLILGSTYSLVALGLTLVFGVLRILNLAQGELFMAGAFAGLLSLEAGAPLFLALLVGMLAAALVGVAMYWIALRPLPAGVDPHMPMIGTMASALIIQQVATRIFSARQHPYPVPPELTGSIDFGFLRLDGLGIFILGFGFLVMSGLAILIRHTRLGLAIRATAENPRVAGLMGISPNAVITCVFALSSALAGVAGVLVGMFFNNVSPYIGVPIGMKGLAAVILGGLGSLGGAMVAGFIIGISEVLTVAYFSSSWRDAAAFAVMIGLLLLRPSGLFGNPQVNRS